MGNQVITESELDQELRVRAFLDKKALDLSPAAKKEALNRLVEQKLVRKETQLSPFPMQEEAETSIADVKKDYGADYPAALQRYGLTEADVQRYLDWENQLLSFIDWRFRRGNQITDQEVEDYFQKTVRPLAQTAHPGQKVTLDEYRDQIEEKLMGERVDKEMEDWLKEARQRTRVEIREDALK